MAKMVQHKDRQIVRPNRTIFTTLCGRMNKQSIDGMNIAATDEEVTCKFCLARMANA